VTSAARERILKLLEHLFVLYAPICQLRVLSVLLENIYLLLKVLLRLNALLALLTLPRLLCCVNHALKATSRRQVWLSAQPVTSTHMQQQLALSASATRDSHGTQARVQHVLKENSRKRLVICSAWTNLLALFPLTLERSQNRRAGIVERITHCPFQTAVCPPASANDINVAYLKPAVARRSSFRQICHTLYLHLQQQCTNSSRLVLLLRVERAVCHISKELVEVMSIVENIVPRRRLDTTSISVGVIILVESWADGSRIIAVLSKDNLNRELETAGVEPMAFFVSLPAIVVKSAVVESTWPEFEVASTLIPVVSVGVLVVIALILGRIYYVRYRVSSKIFPDAFDCTRPPTSVKAGDPVIQTTLPAAMRRDYHIVNFVGGGAKSIVVKAWRIQVEQQMEALAIKLLYADDLFTEAEAEQLQRESLALN